MGEAFLWGTVAGASLIVGGAVALEADGVFADVFEPDELEVAGSWKLS